jgi:membrane dipeptidase
VTGPPTRRNVHEQRAVVEHRNSGADARAESSDAALEARARRLLEKVPLIDGHNDVPWRYRDSANLQLGELDFASDLSSLDSPWQTDLIRLRAGGVGGQFWSVFIPIRQSGGEPGDARTVIEQIDFVKRLAAAGRRAHRDRADRLREAARCPVSRRPRDGLHRR